MDPLLVHLRQLCRAHPTRAKWVFVPSHAIGRTIGDRLAREGTSWANLRFVTPLDVALRMGAPFLVERGIDPSEAGLGPAVIMRLLLDVPADEGYFRPLADQPQLSQALWSTIGELRMAGVAAVDVPLAAFASEAKHRELVALLSSYERFLVDQSRGDRATVFQEALAHPDWCPLKPADCWTELPNVQWAPLERQLLDAMPGERLVISMSAERLANAAVTTAIAPVSLGSTPVDTASASHPAGAAKPGRQRAFFHAGGMEAEVEEVFRRLVASRASLDSAEIVCANPQYSTFIWEKAVRYDWPVTIGRGLPVALTRPGRALLGWTEWVEDDFAAGRLRRLLESGDVRLGRDVAVSAARAARLLVRAQAAWGRRTFRLSLARLAISSRRRAERDDVPDDQRDGLLRRATEAEALGRWIEALVAAVPEPGDTGVVLLGEVAESARAFVDAYAARTSALDRLAASSLIDAIGELGALNDFRCSLAHALRFLRERVDGLMVGADRPRPGHLHVSTLESAGYAGRSCVFVVGLEEGRVFPAPFEDPILLDAERAAIGRRLRLSGERADEAVKAGLARLAVIGVEPEASVTFSYSCRDLREYRQTYASWVLLDAWRAATNNPSATYQDLHRALGAPKSCVPAAPGDALDESRWWLYGATRAGEAARTAVLERYPSLEAGEKARIARASSAFTPWDGYVPAAGALLDPCAIEIGVSPTQLEEAASCPFRHFLRRGLGVEAIESGERDRDVWLDPLLRGTLLHDLYAALLRRCRAAERRVSAAEDAAWFREQGRLALATLATEMPPPSEEVADRESRFFLDDLDLFVRAESALDPSRRPIGFEVGFGRAATDDQEPLARREPVSIDLGSGLVVRIAGRIDRVDEIGPATFEIVDYKTGGYWPDDWKGTFAGGTRLQHALYGLAAVELLRRVAGTPVISGAQYYFSSAKGQQERKRIPTQPQSRVAAVLTDLREVVARGLFVHATSESACKWCDHGHACGSTAAVRAAAKQADPLLAPVRRLEAHE